MCECTFTRHALDLGCGSGTPIADYLIQKGSKITGVDATPSLLNLCQKRHPHQIWIQEDIRSFSSAEHFDAVIVWDCLFHLSCATQRKLFPRLADWVKQGGYLLFNAGWEEDEFWNDMRGHASVQMFNASLSSEEYRRLLKEFGFTIVKGVISDPTIGGRTYFLARKAFG